MSLWFMPLALLCVSALGFFGTLCDEENKDYGKPSGFALTGLLVSAIAFTIMAGFWIALGGWNFEVINY